MIDHDRATLAIYSESRTVAEITASLLLEPTEAANIGEQTRSGRAGRAHKPEYLTYQRTTWLLDVTARSTSDDEGVNALRRLVDIALPTAAALESLRGDCETVIWWSGDSTNTQGTFVFPSSLIKDLAAIGCEVRGTVFLDDHDAGRDGVEFRFDD
ncbi:DUF4279 domain-containing protein [Microbacterium sp. KSW4-4]|uniref:DUF4279 domain-containing protein n=1 Tax=Microbacterium sp. KSW4-4 TaxID=2851651 RepID=UPI001FFD10EA|nr:DUF4279 domain-containing protein [Microbacterium sp. KSW4-4]MCK2034225.1 DUF4279 domain-containing protein [Microbacterium sp. KSW4-4]